MRNPRNKLANRNGGTLYQGKNPGQVVLAFNDQAIPFDGGEASTIPGKSAINNLISQKLMSMLNEMGLDTHFVKRLNMQEHAVLPCEPIPVKLIIRNAAVGTFADNLGIEPSTPFPEAVIEFRHEINPGVSTAVPEQLVSVFDWAAEEELEEMIEMANRINDILTGYFAASELKLVELHLQFGRHYVVTNDGDFEEEEAFLMLVDHLSADSCRLLDLGNEANLTGKDQSITSNTLDGYQLVAQRLSLMPDTSNA